MVTSLNKESCVPRSNSWLTGLSRVQSYEVLWSICMSSSEVKTSGQSREKRIFFKVQYTEWSMPYKVIKRDEVIVELNFRFFSQ